MYWKHSHAQDFGSMHPSVLVDRGVICTPLRAAPLQPQPPEKLDKADNAWSISKRLSHRPSILSCYIVHKS